MVPCCMICLWEGKNGSLLSDLSLKKNNVGASNSLNSFIVKISLGRYAELHQKDKAEEENSNRRARSEIKQEH